MIVKPIVVLLSIVVMFVTIVKELVCSVIQVWEEVLEWFEDWMCGSKWWQKLICWAVQFQLWVWRLVDKVVCDWVLSTVVTILQTVISYVTWILQLICQAIDVSLTLLGCLFGKKKTRCIEVCFRVPIGPDGKLLVTMAKIDEILAESNKILEACNLKFVNCDVLVVKEAKWFNFDPAALLFKPKWFNYFQNHSCSCCNSVTFYLVNSLTGADGYSIPGTSWSLIDINGHTSAYLGQTLVHEFGHLAFLKHTKQQSNFMYEGSNPGTEVKKRQCCLMRRSRFATRKCDCHDAPI